MEKSYVTLVKRTCIFCDKEYDTNEVLLDGTLNKTFEMCTNVGIGLCEEHDKSSEGFILLIEIDPLKSDIGEGGNLKSVYKTGCSIYVKRDVFNAVLNNGNDGGDTPFVFVENGIIDNIINNAK